MKYIHVAFRGTFNHGMASSEGDCFFQVNGDGEKGSIAELRAKCRQSLESDGKTLDNNPTIISISELSEELYTILVGKEALNPET